MIIHFTIRPSAEGKGIEPSSHNWVNLLSRRTQRTSIWLPSVFVFSGVTENRTRRVSGRQGRHAIAVSSRWTITPIYSVDRRGIEPRLPECKSGVFPLDQQPVCFIREVCPGIEPGLPAYHAGVLPKHLQTIFLFRVIPAGLEPALSCRPTLRAGARRRRLRLWTTGSIK